MVNEPVIQISGAAYEHHGETIFRDVNLCVEPGVILAITGPNGAGKTTLIKCLVGIIPWAKGQIDFRITPDDISYVPQKWTGDSVFPLRTGEVLAMGLRAVTPDAELRGGFDLDRLERRAFTGLSVGQQKKVLLVRALERRPRLLVLDEPFAGLDAGSCQYLIKRLSAMASGGGSVLMASHESPYQEALGARVFEMSDGHAGAGSPATSS